MLAWIGIGILGIAALALVLADNPGAAFGVTSADFAQLASAIALLVVLGASLIWSYRGHMRDAVRHAAIWIGIALLLLLGYTYRLDLLVVSQRMLAELVPGMPVISTVTTEGGDQRAVTIRADATGHFRVRTAVNGVDLDLMVDTGATAVTLSYDDARRIGLDMDNLFFIVPIETANGASQAAEVRLKTVSVGGITVSGLRALVVGQGQLRSSLLGMNYLRVVGSFEVRGDELVLKR
ncbi:aspartyl protease family protein [Rhodoligotrophos appendicifer]|uniref:retropepsin-like aspartic protease family protein n=1 Tax=Rhodoligotrophos appendicifer TaxID=987056 RepID=UPI001186DF05|nr:TIGR02281 family clan AA aspartic protease [Rhodoligotrophos appendicifer]